MECLNSGPNRTIMTDSVSLSERTELLRLLRCDEMQGYLLGRPQPAEQFERLLFE